VAIDLTRFDARMTHRPHVLGATNPTITEIYAAQGGRCIDCGHPMPPRTCMTTHEAGYTIDHVFPRSLGFGLFANKTLACRECNERKADRPPSRRTVLKARSIYERLLPRRAVRFLRHTHPLWTAYPPHPQRAHRIDRSHHETIGSLRHAA